MLHTMEFYFYFIYLICSWSTSCVIYLGGNIYLGVDLGPVFLNDIMQCEWQLIQTYSIWNKKNKFISLTKPSTFVLSLPVRGRTAHVHGPVQVDKPQDLDKAVIQQLRDRCEQQALQIQSLQVHMKEASLCLDVFSITTQHFWKKVGQRAGSHRWLSLQAGELFSH